MAFIKTNDGTGLYYKDWGTGLPVVLVHGWAISGDSWEYVAMDLVERGFRCIAYDLRGCGRSDQPGTGYDYDTLADDLAALIDSLDLQDVTLVGHSMGGGLITRYLTQHGEERIAQAVLIGTTTPFPLKTADNPEGIDKVYFDQAVEQILTDRPRYVAALAPPFFGSETADDSVSPEMIRWGIDLTLQASAIASVQLLRTSTESDQREELTRITIPTLLLHGDQDVSSPLTGTGERTHALLQNSRLTVYEGKAHGIYITDARQVSADIAAFIGNPNAELA
jgi:non-heme chloroperoxidase